MGSRIFKTVKTKILDLLEWCVTAAPFFIALTTTWWASPYLSPGGMNIAICLALIPAFLVWWHVVFVIWISAMETLVDWLWGAADAERCRKHNKAPHVAYLRGLSEEIDANQYDQP